MGASIRFAAAQRFLCPSAILLRAAGDSLRFRGAVATVVAGAAFVTEIGVPPSERWTSFSATIAPPSVVYFRSRSLMLSDRFKVITPCGNRNTP